MDHQPIPLIGGLTKLTKLKGRRASRLFRRTKQALSIAFVMLLVVSGAQVLNSSVSAEALPGARKGEDVSLEGDANLLKDNAEIEGDEIDDDALGDLAGDEQAENEAEAEDPADGASGKAESSEEDSTPEDAVEEDAVEDDELETGDDEELKQEASNSAKNSMIAPMSVSVPGPGGTYHMPDPNRPYLAFEVKDTAGNHVGGATVNLQGPRGWSNTSWGSSVAIVDCVSGANACAANSLDQDSRPGHFAVDRRSVGIDIQSGSRYRIGASGSAPAGHTWTTGALTNNNETTATNNTVTGITAGSRATAANGQWVSTPNPGGSGNNLVNTLNGPTLESYAPQCTAGYLYAVSASGQLQKISPTGTNAARVDNVGTSASWVSNFNGIGVTPHTSTVNPGSIYATERSAGSGTNVNGRVYKFNTTTGQWARISSGNGWDINGGSNLVGGAASPDGNYWAGGFNSNNDFTLWSLNTAGNGMVNRGTLNLGQYRSSSGNGDFSFDSVGNLYLVRGLNTGSELAVFRVDAADLQAGGNAIPVTRIYNGTGGTGVNGVAYDSTGKLYVGGGDWLRYISLSAIGAPTQVSLTGTLSSTDLASCSYPPTVTLQKNLPDGRAANGHQFGLTLRSGTNTLGTATTAGSASGIQPQKVGPIPAAVGSAINFTETFNGNGNSAAQYSSGWSCFIEGEATPIASGTGASGSMTVPDREYGSEIVCTFTNSIPQIKKSSNPASGTTVEEGTIVEYTLTFDNSAGLGPITIAHRDHLKDVLDDAFFVNAQGNQVQAPVISTSGGATATWAATSQWINIGGTVQPGQIATVTFRVKVKENTDNTDERRNQNAPLEGFLLRNYLTPGTVTTPPATCDDSTNMCTEHPVPAWSFSKTSLPADGARLHKGGNAHYKLEAVKMNSNADIKELTFRDDLTHVFKTAGWAPDAAVPGGALPRGVYFFNSQGQTLDQAGNITATQPSPAYAATEVGPPTQQSGRWIIEKTVTMPTNAISAEMWFAVKAGESPVNIPDTSTEWTGDNNPGTGWFFTNYATASATHSDDSSFTALQCDTSTVPAHDTSIAATDDPPYDTNVPEACRVTHELQANYFTIRKDAAGVGEDLPRSSTWGTDSTGLWNMIGHEFEIHDDNNGAPSQDPSEKLCRSSSGTPDWGENSQTLADILTWNNDNPGDQKELCAIFYPQTNAGGQTGRWRAENLPEGDYWLIETKAPDRQINLAGTQTRPVPGVQLLADPVPFRVWQDTDGSYIGGSSQSMQGRGQLDVASESDFSEFGDRCLPESSVSERPAACVNPTGYLMIVKDSVPMKLPLSGGFGTGAYVLGGMLALGMAVTAASLWRRMHTVTPTRGRYAAGGPSKPRGRHQAD